MATITIQGKTVTVDDEFLNLSREEQDAVVEDIAADMQSRGDFDSGKSKESPADAWNKARGADYVSEGMSGVYEGAADLLGFPVDMIAGGMNAGIDAANTGLGTNIPRIDKPVGGSQTFRELFDPVIGEESTEPGKQVVRRIGQEIGSAMIPGVGMAVKAAKPAAMIGNTLKTAIGSGAGAAVAEQVAPGNIWAEIAGQVAGGGVSSLIKGGKGSSVPKAPTADELQQLKRDAYKTVDNLGVSYTPQGLNQMAGSIAAATAKASAIRHPKTVSMVQDIKEWTKNGMSLTELDELRQRVRLDLIRSGDEAEAMWGEAILAEIDDFIAKAGAGQIASGSGPDANKAILAARELNTRWRKTEMIEDAYYKAEMQTAATGSGGNINNKIKQALTSIITNEKSRRAFTADELKEMESVVKNGKGEDLLRLVGKLSPSGNGLMAMLGIGGTAVNPLMAAVPLTGMAAKKLADSRTIKKAATLRANIASGKGNTLSVPSPDRGLAAGAATIGGISAVNDNERRTNTLRMKALN